MSQKQHMIRAISVLGLILAGLVGCQWWDREQRTPTMPGMDSSSLTNYAQIDNSSIIIDGQQINWVVSEWGSMPYGAWMYVEINQQDESGKQPGEHQIPVSLGNVVLHFSELPDEVTQIMIGVKAGHDDTQHTFIERDRFAVVSGNVSIPLNYRDLVSYFGVTHYSIWFQAIGGKNGEGVVCGQIAISGSMPDGQAVMLRKNLCFGSNQATPIPTLTDLYVATTGLDSNTCTSPAAPCQTITEALGKALDNTFIHINAGTYPENVAIAGINNLMLRGEGGTVTIQPATGNGVTVTAATGVFVQDLSITAAGSGSDGMAVYSGGTVELTNVDIDGAWQLGLRVYNTGSSVTMSDGSITNNSGSGAYVGSSGMLSLTNVTITANAYGLEIGTGSDATVVGGSISGSIADGIWLSSGTADLTNVIVTGGSSNNGIFSSNSILTVSGGSVSGATGVVNAGTAEFTNVMITGNYSGLEIGGMFFIPATATVVGGSITGLTKNGIYVWTGSTVTDVSNVTITGANYAIQCQSSVNVTSVYGGNICTGGTAQTSCCNFFPSVADVCP